MTLGVTQFCILTVTLAPLLICATQRPKTLLVAFDGFAQDYFSTRLFFLPWFDNFRRNEGVHSVTIRSVFPTESFPNLHSIATGLYPESHGIVGNYMLDRENGKVFNKSTAVQEWWNSKSDVEPIWISARKNLGMKTAIFAWPGGDVYYSNITADYVRPYDASVPFRNRVDDMVQLMSEEDVDLGFLYHFQPDQTGHGKGILGPHMANELIRADWLLSYVILATERAGLTNKNLNLIVCSDHGMASVERIIYLEDFINVGSHIETTSKPSGYLLIWPWTRMVGRVYGILKRASIKSDGFWSVYTKDEIPKHFNYRNSDRIAPIIAIGKLGTMLSMRRSHESDSLIHSGAHGFDPSYQAMRPMFMARGPGFNRGVNDSLAYTLINGKARKRREPDSTKTISLVNPVISTSKPKVNFFETKDIYALLAHLIGLDLEKQPPNNASLEHFKLMLSNNGANNRRTFTSLASILTVLHMIKFIC